MEPQRSEIPGYFLSFTPPEKLAIDEMLMSGGYEPGGAGVKRFLLDVLESDENVETEGPVDRLMNKVEDFVIGNPETVKKAIDLGGAILKTVRRRK